MYLYQVFISSLALQDMLYEYLIITQLTLMEVLIILPQKAACGPHRQMGCYQK